MGDESILLHANSNCDSKEPCPILSPQLPSTPSTFAGLDWNSVTHSGLASQGSKSRTQNNGNQTPKLDNRPD